VVAIERIPVVIDPGAAPVYQQIEEQVEAAITAGVALPGDKLPPERELADQLGVSRMTVRQAFDGLARRGLVERGVGRGTFVTTRKVDLDRSRLAGFTEQMERAGLEHGARLIGREVVEPPADVAGELRLLPGALAVHVVRVRSGGGVPLTIEDFWLPLAIFPGVDEADMSGSIYALMRERYQRAPVRAVERMEPVPAPAPDARLLGIPPRSPVMLVERVAYDDSGTPVKFARDRHRGDRARFVLEVQAGG
jgi:GntR family transcriptional regulator